MKIVLNLGSDVGFIKTDSCHLRINQTQIPAPNPFMNSSPKNTTNIHKFMTLSQQIRQGLVDLNINAFQKQIVDQSTQTLPSKGKNVLFGF